MDLQGAIPVQPAPVNQSPVMHQLQQQQPQQQPPMQQQAPLHQPAMVYDNSSAPNNNYQTLNNSYSNNHHHQQHQQQPQQTLNSTYYGSHEVAAQVQAQPPHPPTNEHQVVQYNMQPQPQPQQQTSISPHDSWSNGSYYQPSQSPYPGSISSQPYPQMPYNGAGATNQHGTPPCHQPSPIPAPNHNMAPQPISTPNHYMHPHGHPPPPSHSHQNGVIPVQPTPINHSPVMHQQPAQQPMHQQQPPMHQPPQQLQQPMHHQQQQPPIHQQQPPIHQQAPPPHQTTMVYDNATPTNTYPTVNPYSNNLHHHHQQQPQQTLNSTYYGSHEVAAQVQAQPPHPPPNEHQVVQYNMQPQPQPQQQTSISPHDSWSNGSYYQPSQSPYPGSISSQPYPQMPYNGAGATNQHGTPPCHQPSPIPASTHPIVPQPMSTPNHYMHPHGHSPHQTLPSTHPHQMHHQQPHMNQIAPQPQWQPHSQMPIIERNKTTGQEKKPVKPRAPKKQTNPNAPSGRRKRPLMTEEHKQSGYAKFYQIKKKELKTIDFGMASSIIAQEWNGLSAEEKSFYVKDVSIKRRELLKKKASQQAQDLLVQGMKQEQDIPSM